MLELRSAGTRPIGHDFYGGNCNKPVLAAATKGEYVDDAVFALPDVVKKSAAGPKGGAQP